MLMKQIIDVFAIVDTPAVNGEAVRAKLLEAGVPAASVTVTTISGEKGSTDFIKTIIPGSRGKSNGGDAPTLGVIGRLGGLGARPSVTGFVSDGDGALTALAVAFKLWDMHLKGDQLAGDVVVTTHICPHAPTLPHDPVPFMGSPVDMEEMNAHEVTPEMDAILALDTTRGNQVINHNGFALSPTVKAGYILRVSEDLLRIMQITSGSAPVTFPITIPDITPYGNGLHHLNSILQPCTATDAPVVGVAITSHSVVPGCATGACNPVVAEGVARFAVEVAKAFTAGACSFYDPEEVRMLHAAYGSMKHLQTNGSR